ncbi:hypothetical protein H5410_002529, partial [Solanum commersonii]
MKKKRPDHRLTHWVSRQVAMISPKVSACQAIKEKIKWAIERSSRQMVPRCSARSPKVIELKDAEGQIKMEMELTKWQITEWIGDLDLLCRMYLSIIVLNYQVVVANATLPSSFWLARDTGFKTKITDLMTKVKIVLNCCLLVFERNQFDS